MKRKIILSLITICVLSFASCSNNTTETSETTVPVETTVEATQEPTATPESTATPTVAPTATPDATSTPTPTPDTEASDKSVDEIAAEENYTLSEQEKADLRVLGTTEEQINNVKSGQDFIDLVYKLVGAGGGSTGDSSSDVDIESNDATGDGNDNDLPTAKLDDPSIAPAGRM